MTFYQGEIIEEPRCAGQFEYNGEMWTKLEFDDDHGNKRYGYIKAKDAEPMDKAKIDESSLVFSEVPASSRHFEAELSEKERKRLARDGFYVHAPSPKKDIYADDMADSYHVGSSAIFLTSDLFLHSFHLLFDRMLQDVEAKKIFPAMQALTLGILAETKKDIDSLGQGNEDIRKALLQNLAFFSVAAKLFDPKFVPDKEVEADVNAITAAIVAADGRAPKLEHEMTIGADDFTQYKVRGHYQEKSVKGSGGTVETDDTLARYFRAMMWYGRQSFLVSSDRATLSAILMVRGLENSGSLKEWERIDGVLTKLIGKTDDWGPRDYRKVSKLVFGKEVPEIADIAKGGGNALKSFELKAREILKGQRIVSSHAGAGKKSHGVKLKETEGFKFLGQRFMWDAYIFNRLTSPAIAAEGPPRPLPYAVDVMAVFGSAAAGDLTAEMQRKNNWNGYEAGLKGLKIEMAGEIEKKETFYDAWMETLKSLFVVTRSKQLFAVKEPWQYKNLNSALGSWTEAKHDTILYSEQSHAEQGSGDSFEIPSYIEPYVRGYVEPNILFFTTIGKAVSRLREDLGSDFLTEEYRDKFLTFEDLVKDAGEIAKKQVEGSPITKDDYMKINSIANSIDRGLLLPRDSGDIVDDEYLKMALIADVATSADGMVRSVAIGVPQFMLVVVKDYYGGTRLTSGYIYSWYEFASNKRWTDKEWKAKVYSDDPEIKKLEPEWYRKIRK
ncbi:MAG: DUF3160 domain-containing protein [Deltaproteobacteria bacterium]|nr:DUF3160 domain-containing protein [Deltaproteobacteria bacterium]